MRFYRNRKRILEGAPALLGLREGLQPGVPGARRVGVDAALVHLRPAAA